MEVYIIVFLVEMLLGLVFLGRFPNTAAKGNKIFYLVLSTIILSFLCGSRSMSVGFDTESYARIFSRTSDSWQYALYSDGHIEIGFSVLCTFVKLLGGDFNMLLLICSFFTMGCAHIFIYRHSDNVLLSVFILICFPFYYSSFDIVRHYLSIGFLLLGYKYILEKRFLYFLLFILCGSFFHKTSLIYLLFYPLFQLRWNKKNAFFIGLCGIMLMSSAQVLASFVVETTGKYEVIADEWVGEFSGGVITCLMYFIIFLLSKKEFKIRVDYNPVYNSYLYIVFCLFILSVVFTQVRIATRYIMLFAGLLSIAIPGLFNAKKSLRPQKTRMRLTIFIVIGILYHIFMLKTNWQNIVPYVPYWLFSY